MPYRISFRNLLPGFAGIILITTFAFSSTSCKHEAAPPASEEISTGAISEEIPPELAPEAVEIYTPESIQEALKENPDQPDLLLQLMIIRMEQGDYNGALKVLQPIDDLGDRTWSAQAHMLAGKIVKDKMVPGADESLRGELLKQAESQFEMALDMDSSPASLAAYWYLGELQYSSGDVQDAIDNLSVYLTFQPFAYDVRLKLAEIYIEQGNKVRAEELLEGMKSDPNDERRLKAEALLKGLDHQDMRYTRYIIAGAVCTLILIILFFAFKRFKAIKRGRAGSNA